VFSLKKLWRNYSYSIILVVLSLVASIIIKTNLTPTDADQYMTITIKDGESLWEISQKYEEQHGLSREEFFKWVEKHNGVSRDYIVAGKDLVVPIKSEPIAIDEVQELASR
jgi:cell division protein YceG involved in septum cleavage